jgi:hypothetical protein
MAADFSSASKNYSSEVERLKVDVLVIPYDQSRTNRMLAFLNINVPLSYIKDAESRETTLNRIYKYIEIEFSEYDNFNVRYKKYLASELEVEITATYTLRNLVTDEIKHWTGSFNPSANDMGSLLKFIPMSKFKTSESFVSHVSNLVDPTIALRLLTWKGGSTKFKVEQLTSVIFNFQCSLPTHHRFLTRRNVGGNSRNTRATYDLP